MAVVHSNIWDQKLRRHVNQMWRSLYAGSQDRLGLLLADDDELWQLTVVHTEMTDMMGPAHVDICRQAGKVCIRYVDRPVAITSFRWNRNAIELAQLQDESSSWQTAEDGCSLLSRGKEHCYRNASKARLQLSLSSLGRKLEAKNNGLISIFLFPKNARVLRKQARGFMLSSYSSISSIQHSPTLGRHQQRSSHYSVRHCIWLRLNVFVADSGKSRVFSDFDWLTIQTAPLARSFSERFHFRVLNSTVILSGFVQSENTCPSLVTKHSTRNHVYSPFCILETYCYFRREGCLRVFGMGYFSGFIGLSVCLFVCQ